MCMQPWATSDKIDLSISRVRSEDGEKLLPGTLVDIGSASGELESEFFPGQLLGGGGDDENGDESVGDVKFVAGQWSEEEGGFVLGQVTLGGGGDGEIVLGQTVR